MTKLSDVAPKPDQLKVGMTLKIKSVTIEQKEFDGDMVDSAVIESEGKTYWTTSQPIVNRLKSKQVQEFFANNAGKALECEVKEAGEKRKYMYLE